MDFTRRGLINVGAPVALCGAVAGSVDPTARLLQMAAGAGEARRLEDFGAVGDFDPVTGEGTDDTRAIQTAIDWAYGAGRNAARALLVDSKNYLCGPITTHPYTTMLGTGRHTSNFICRPGTSGAWWSDRGNGAQKLMLSGLAFYGNGQRELSAVCRFGRDGIQFGTEGILQGLWMRDAPKGTALDLSGNVGIVRDITLQACRTGIEIYGNGNQVENIISMEATIGARFAGCFVRGLHIEAVADGGRPLIMNGDCRISDVMFSLASDTAFEHLVEVETADYEEWSLKGVQVFPRNAELKRSLIRAGDDEFGGTDLKQAASLDIQPSLELHSAGLSLGGQAWQAFALEVQRVDDKVRASLLPLGTKRSTSLLKRIMKDWFTRSDGEPQWRGEGRLELGPIPSRVEGFGLVATIVRNTTGRPVTADIGIVEGNGGAIMLTLYDGLTGQPLTAAEIPRREPIRIAISGFGS